MAIEYWIQIDNPPWDLSPHNVDRMTGQNMQAVTGQPPAMVTLTSLRRSAGRRGGLAPPRGRPGHEQTPDSAFTALPRLAG